MFCTNCGTQFPEGAEACPNCGKRVEKEINFSDVTNYARQKAHQASEGIRGGVQGIRQERAAERAVIRDVSEMFVSNDEQARRVIGGGFLDNWIQSGGLNKGFGVLTNRRLYYRGKCFHKLGGGYVRTKEDCIVDLQDITSSGFLYTQHIWMLLLAIVGFIALFYTLFSDAKEAAPYIFIVSVLLLAAYFIFRSTMYTVTFAGGSLSIKASSYGIKDLKAFDKELHQAKDEHLKRLLR